MDDRQVSGVAAGVDERGVLMIQSEGATVRVISGSIIVPGLREASQ